MADLVRIWAPPTPTIALTAVDFTANTIGVAGDLAAAFSAGRKLRIEGATSKYADLSGLHTVASDASYSTGTTTIALADDIVDGGGSGAMGSIIDYPLAYTDFIGGFVDGLPEFNDPRTYFTDRNQLKRAVRPADATAAQRFVQQFTLALKVMDFDLLGSDGVRFHEFLWAHCVAADDELTVFWEYDGVDSGGHSYTERKAFTALLQGVPAWPFGTKANAEQTSDIPLVFSCFGNAGGTAGDGVYSDLDDFSSTTYRARPA